MPKEPYITPEIESEEIEPSALAQSGSPAGNGPAAELLTTASALGICCTPATCVTQSGGGCGCPGGS